MKSDSRFSARCRLGAVLCMGMGVLTALADPAAILRQAKAAEFAQHRRPVCLRFRRTRPRILVHVMDIPHAAVAPAVLVVADEAAGGVGGQGRLAGAGEPEEGARA